MEKSKIDVEPTVMKEGIKTEHKMSNDICSICGVKFEAVVPVIKIDGKAYHMSCYEKINKGV